MVKMADDVIYKIPTRQEIEDLKEGDTALNPFGEYGEITNIFARRDDVEGKLFICYYTKWGGNGSSISSCMKEGELVRHLGVCHHHNSHELRLIEKQLREQM